MPGRFRGDVQGLRAVAVLTVIAAHFGVPGLSGGFVGVDIFFVISGFLISGLLFGELRTGGHVSLTGFWSRRARRILPAATVVTVVTVIAGLVTLPLLTARELLGDAVWSSLFLANVHFAQQGVYYFATDTGPSALQHYWSLAVEEQFYVVWPLLLVACVAVARRVSGLGRQQRLPRRGIMGMLVVLTIASFTWSMISSQDAPAEAYFSTLARAWELGVGAITALLVPQVAHRMPRIVGWLLSVGGVVGVAVACVAYDAQTVFPGYAAALPVLATAALLMAGARPDGLLPPVRAVLTSKPARTVGDWSYSLYLWHWPALILAEHHLGHDLTPAGRIVLLLIVFNLAGLTFRFVEEPFRSGGLALRLPTPRTLVLYPASLVVVGLVLSGGQVYTNARGGEFGDNPAITVKGKAAKGDDTVALVKESVEAARQKVGIPSNLNPNLLDLRNSIADVGACDYENDVRSLCVRGDPNGDHTLVLIGDSHARAWIPAMDQITADAGWRAFYLVKPQCPAGDVTVSPVNEPVVFSACDEFHQWVSDQVAALHPDLTVIASSPPVNGVWQDGKRLTSINDIAPVLEQGYDRTFADLGAHSDRVVVIKDVPKSHQDPGECLTGSQPSLLNCMFTPVERSTILGDIVVKSALLNGAEVVDPTPWLCWQDECPVVIGDVLSYRDTDHITTEYAARLAGALGHALQLDDKP
ncbi:acyltransferase family protein [Nocardioides acrostichi]|uniref:Acyltransferase n=1 Tax=Nocardioides acrostichi TaxID=2784339 RepID=A0A930UVP4_9ACTN|nr:acyltransferase family protein [Nocardioides acrostichi]MBF4161728.1 acyltransferase [Nocardioides acrostichi]